MLGREDSQSSLGMSNLDVEDEEDDEGLRDPRKWLKVVNAFEQPRLVYNVGKKHFDRFAPSFHCLNTPLTSIQRYLKTITTTAGVTQDPGLP